MSGLVRGVSDVELGVALVIPAGGLREIHRGCEPFLPLHTSDTVPDKRGGPYRVEMVEAAAGIPCAKTCIKTFHSTTIEQDASNNAYVRTI